MKPTHLSHEAENKAVARVFGEPGSDGSANRAKAGGDVRAVLVPKANQLVGGLLASRTSNFTLVMPDLTISSRSAAASDKSMIRP